MSLRKIVISQCFEQKSKINKMRTNNQIIERGLIEKIFGGVGTQKGPNTN